MISLQTLHLREVEVAGSNPVTPTKIKDLRCTKSLPHTVLTRWAAVSLLVLAAPVNASVFMGACIMEHEEPFTETCFPGLELEAYYQCGGGEQSPGYVYHPDIGLRHFLLWAPTPQGNVYVVDDIIMRTSFGDTCNPDGSVVEE